jgi:hypothetical protein
MTPGGNFGATFEQRLGVTAERSDAVAATVKRSLRVALVGIVQKFYPGPPPTVDVIISTNEYVTQNFGGDVISIKTTAMRLPRLYNVPIFIPSGGNFSFTCPIQEGDEALVIFCDVPLDVWLEAGGIDNNPIAQRWHSLSNGIALLGLSSKPHSFSDYSTTSAQLRSDDGTVVVDLADNQITVTAPNVTVNATTANITASGNANVTGETVKLTGTSITFDENSNTRDWFTHAHSIPGGGTTGPVL